MKAVVTVIVSVLLLLGLTGLAKDWLAKPIVWQPPRAIFLLPLLFIAVALYLGIALAHSRNPMVAVGRLRVDLTNDEVPIFHLKVENLGPGSVEPIATVTYIKDELGNAPRFILSPKEAHWRNAPDKDWHPKLRVGDIWYAGILKVIRPRSTTPVLAIYPIDLQPIPLWDADVPIDRQPRVRIKLTVSYVPPDTDATDIQVVKRSYLIKPDKDARSRYKAQRVRIRSAFWD